MILNYSGRFSLIVSYQWDIVDNSGKYCGTNDATIFSGTFDNINEAYDRLELIIPKDYIFDDGVELQEWAETPGPDTFTQYAAYIDKEHVVLAVLRPTA